MAVKRIMPAEAKELLGKGYVYVDVRSVPEYEQGHPEGAVNAPVMHMMGGGMAPNNEFVAVMQKAFPKDAKLVLGCKSGMRSQRAAMLLEGAGFTNLLEMTGGWSGEQDGTQGWSALGYPTLTAPTPGGSWAELQKK
jgi:rhodanese-related sulfurtransferase